MFFHHTNSMFLFVPLRAGSTTLINYFGYKDRLSLPFRYDEFNDPYYTAERVVLLRHPYERYWSACAHGVSNHYDQINHGEPLPYFGIDVRNGQYWSTYGTAPQSTIDLVKQHIRDIGPNNFYTPSVVDHFNPFLHMIKCKFKYIRFENLKSYIPYYGNGTSKYNINSTELNKRDVKHFPGLYKRLAHEVRLYNHAIDSYSELSPQEFLELAKDQVHVPFHGGPTGKDYTPRKHK